MLNFTPATAIHGSAAAETDAALAAMRPLAGFGAGAFTCEARVGSGANGLAASPSLPGIRGAVVAASIPAHAQADGRGSGAYQPGAYRSGTVGTSTVRTSTVRTAPSPHSSTVGTSSVGTQQFSVMALINPVTPGGLGPHPAREPEPV